MVNGMAARCKGEHLSGGKSLVRFPAKSSNEVLGNAGVSGDEFGDEGWHGPWPRVSIGAGEDGGGRGNGSATSVEGNDSTAWEDGTSKASWP